MLLVWRYAPHSESWPNMPAINLVKNRTALPFVSLTIKVIVHHFLVDTGAEITILAPELINNIKPHRISISSGCGGNEISHSVKAKFNLMGKTVTEIVKANGSLKKFSESIGMKISGILGQDLLKQFSNYTIDNKQQKFIFSL